MDEESFDYSINYTIAGNSLVGKTKLVERFIGGAYKEDYVARDTVEYYNKNITLNNKKYHLNLWEMTANERFITMNNNFFRKCDCALFVYQINEKDSFKSIPDWIVECENNAEKEVLKVLVGNKCDLENERQVSREEGEEFAEKNKMLFYEASAKTGNNVENVFKGIAEKFSEKIAEDNYNLENDSIEMKKKDENNKKIKKKNLVVNTI